MKKILSVLGASLIFLLMFSGQANPVEAAEPTSIEDENCTCHEVTPIVGFEKYEIVLNLLVSNEFKKTIKKQLKEGYIWNFTKEIEVMKHSSGTIMVGVPFKDKYGIDFMAAFFDGKYMGISPAEAPNH